MYLIIGIGFIIGLIIGKEIMLSIEEEIKDKQTKQNIKDYCNFQIARTQGQKQEMYKKIAEIF